MACKKMVEMVFLIGFMILGHSMGMEKVFFESFDDIGRIQRNLLQAEEGSGAEKVCKDEVIDVEEKNPRLKK